MSTHKSVDDVIKEIEYWIRLSTLLHSGIKEALLSVLHNDSKDLSYVGLSRNPTVLYHELCDPARLNALNQLKHRRILSREQWDILFPATFNTLSDEFDVTLICIVIINCTGIPPPTTGWDHKRLLSTDHSKAASVLRCRSWRNFVHHTEPDSIDAALFARKWTEGEDIIKAIGYKFDTITLKTVSLDPSTSTRQKLILKTLDEFCKKEVTDHSTKLASQKADIQNIIARLASCDSKLKIQDSKIESQGKQIQLQQKGLDKLDKDFQSLQNQVDFIKEKFTEENSKIEGDGEVITGETLERINVFRSIEFGCIFKLKLKHKNRNVASVEFSTRKQPLTPAVRVEDNFLNEIHLLFGDECGGVGGDGGGDGGVDLGKGKVVYTTKAVNDSLLLVKISNLTEGYFPCIQITTEDDVVYRAERVLIYGNEGLMKCNHVLKANNFIVISPPLGQVGDSYCCIKDEEKEDSILNDEVIYLVVGCTTERLTIQEFLDKGFDYLKRNFPKYQEELVHFVPSPMIEDDATRKVAGDFESLLQLVGKGFRAILANVDLTQYRLFTRKGRSEINSSTQNNRLLVFDENNCCQLNIRVVDGQGGAYAIYQAMKTCVADLADLANIMRRLNCCIVCVGIIACPNMSKESLDKLVSFYFSEQNLTGHRRLFFLSKDDLSDNALQGWWRNTVAKELKRVNTKIDYRRNLFARIVGQFMLTMALVDSSLPTLSSDSFEQICSLLLSKDQYEAVYDASPNKLIVGGFGTGKSIVGDEILKTKHQCFLGLGKKCLLLHVTWDPFSLIEVRKKNYIDELKKQNKDHPNVELVTLRCGNLNSLSRYVNSTSNKFSEFLEKVSLLPEHDLIHVVVDEFSSDGMQESEIPQIRSVLTKGKVSVTLIPQSIEMKRSFDVDGMTVQHKTNWLNSLGEKDFKECKLNKTMRNSRIIAAVMKYSQKLIGGIPNSVKIPRNLTDDDVTSPRRDDKMDGDGDLSKNSTPTWVKPISWMVEKLPSFTWGIAPTSASENNGARTDPETATPTTATDVKSEELQEVVNKFSLGDVDKASKFMEQNIATTSMRTSSMKTVYKFHTVEPGHGIDGCVPVFINLPESFSISTKCKESALVLSHVFQEICFPKFSDTILTCNNIEEAQIVSYALKHVPKVDFECYFPQFLGVFPTIEEKQFAIDRFKSLDGGRRSSKVIVTDNSAVKGLEAERVIMLVQPGEKVLRHVFVELIARANMEVFVIQLPTAAASSSETTTTATTTSDTTNTLLAHVLKDLTDKRLFDVQTVLSEEDFSSFEAVPKYENNTLHINLTALDPKDTKPSFKEHLEEFKAKYPVHEDVINQRQITSDFVNFVMNEENEIFFDDKKRHFPTIYNKLKRKEMDTISKTINGLPDEDNKRTLLMNACWDNNEEIVKHLLELHQSGDRADLFATDKGGSTVMHLAVGNHDNVNILRMLLEVDRSLVNVVDREGATPLHVAATINRRECVKFLLENGANVNAEKHNSDTPFSSNEEIDKMIESLRNAKKK